MIAQRQGIRCRTARIACCCFATLPLALLQQSASAISILVDYRYDSNEFFTNQQQRKDALQAAANRYSAIITSSLSAVTLTDDNVDARIGFVHPGTADVFRVSSAAGPLSDSVKLLLGQSDADEYRGTWSVDADQWILYAGGRDMGAQGVGGQRSVVNLSSVGSSSGSIVNRNFRSSGTTMNLPVWGGSIAFDSDGTNWHFDHTTAAPNGAVDFYSLALHEIGHALGLSSNWLEWTSRIVGRQYSGPAAVAAYNADNGTTLATLNVETAAPSLNPHWDDGAYDSLIFSSAGPNYLNTVGAGTLQDLLMETFLQPLGRRFELTNVDVAALRDVGWTTMPQINVQLGDFNGDGTVDTADYIPISKGLANSNYATWKANFGESLPPAMTWSDSAHVPEPHSIVLFAIASIALYASRRQPALLGKASSGALRR